VNDPQAKSIYVARATALRQENDSIIDRYIAAITK
jgi:hypothetical protein